MATAAAGTCSTGAGTEGYDNPGAALDLQGEQIRPEPIILKQMSQYGQGRKQDGSPRMESSAQMTHVSPPKSSNSWQNGIKLAPESPQTPGNNYSTGAGAKGYDNPGATIDIDSEQTPTEPVISEQLALYSHVGNQVGIPHTGPPAQLASGNTFRSSNIWQTEFFMASASQWPPGDTYQNSNKMQSNLQFDNTFQRQNGQLVSRPLPSHAPLYTTRTAAGYSPTGVYPNVTPADTALHQQPYYSQPSVKTCAHNTYAWFVCCFCGILFGGVALVLIYLAKDLYTDGDRTRGKRMLDASLIVSTAGLLIGASVLVTLIVLFVGAAS